LKQDTQREGKNQLPGAEYKLRHTKAPTSPEIKLQLFGGSNMTDRLEFDYRLTI
jgi:hypothetical protein